jgi:asparagine synthase (glutamine-hydrolysing)
MCGIAGVHSLNGPLFLPTSRYVQAFDRLLSHRGPDGSGTWSNLEGNTLLYHRRLAIIDTSTEAAQPMESSSGPTVAFNGEIYNYRELRQLTNPNHFQYKTSSDTETIIAMYEIYGKSACSKLRGMFAFALWDEPQRRLILARDRFGIKPFYYILAGDRLYFASEIKTLKVSPLFRSEINIHQVSRGLQMGWLGYFDETYFNCVKSLPAAFNLYYDESGFRTLQYWDLQTGSYSGMDFEEKKHHFYKLFNDSIGIHLRSDVPVASCLSGGLDSSAIVSAVQHLHPGLNYKTFSIYYQGKGDVDERPFINEVVKKYPNVDPIYYSPGDEEVTEHFDKALYHADVPASGSSFMSQYFLMKLIRESGIKVVLDGQGADEYLAGYMHTFYRYIGQMLSSGRIGAAVKETLRVNRLTGSGPASTAAHFSKSLLSSVKDEQSLYGFEYRHYYPFMVNGIGAGEPFNLKQMEGSKMDNFLYHLIFTTSLPSLLHYEDRNSMAFSVESRVPFLDHRLLEFVFLLHDEDKIHNGKTKYVMREALKPILPEAIYARTDKKGFVTPGESKWLRGPLKHLMDDMSMLNQITDKKKTAAVLRNYSKGDDSQASLVWRLVVLNYWLKNA